ncbi:MAG: AzlC family ABC transporter permease [Spirochaetaceae bacterium]|nr:AzlC family ABC transporter permease [Spirochaetaceae bacterium]
MNAALGLRLFPAALAHTVPVLMGYLAIGVAFGLLLQQAGYPAYLAFFMSVVMYAGAAQYISAGLFAAGAPLWEAALIQLVVNARHIAYGLSMLKRYNSAGPYKWYLIFAMTDETFALLSAADERVVASGPDGAGIRLNQLPPRERGRYLFLVSVLNQSYWVAGSVIGAVCGSLLPFKIEGIGFALPALFIVLMLEQMLAIKKILPFVVAAASAVLCVAVLPARVSLLSAIACALVAVQLASRWAARGRP